MFSYFSQWVANYSETNSFPLPKTAKKAFEYLKIEAENSIVYSNEQVVPFTEETGASNHTTAVTLNQSGRPVTFFSMILSISEQKQSSIYKEAKTNVEAFRKRRHYLIGCHFSLVPDQISVACLTRNRLGKSKKRKFKGESCSYEIRHCMGRYVTMDASSRTHCPVVSSDTLDKICNSFVTPALREWFIL